MATLFMVFSTIIIIGWLWFFIVRPVLESWGVITDGVNTFQDDARLDAALLSRDIAQTAADSQTDDLSARLSEADAWLDRLEVDRTRAGWVELMVYIGYSGSEIRTLLKGDNGAIGSEVDAARKKLGIDPPVTPIAGRPTDAKYADRPDVVAA